jgi:hypothetical protein
MMLKQYFLRRIFGKNASYGGILVIPTDESLVGKTKGLRYTVINPSEVERSFDNMLETDFNGVLILCRNTRFEIMYALSIARKISVFNTQPIILIKTTRRGELVKGYSSENYAFVAANPEDFPLAFQYLVQAILSRKLAIWRGAYFLRVHRIPRGGLGVFQVEEDTGHILIFHPREFNNDVEEFKKILKISENLRGNPEPVIETIETSGNSLTMLLFQIIHN